jgi:hypothetical protein
VGAPRIHGELRMLGIEVAESTIGRYMGRTRRPPSQGWRTFLSNYVAGIASLDLFVVRTLSFKLLYGLVIAPRAPPDCFNRRYHQSHRPMDCGAGNRRLSVGRGAKPFDPGPRPSLRSRLHPALVPRAYATIQSSHARRGRTVTSSA